MKTISDRCREMVLHLEWSMNLMDCQGGRCPACSRPRPLHEADCRLGKLCDDLRTVERARALEG